MTRPARIRDERGRPRHRAQALSIDTVFLTSFKPHSISGIEAFPKAKILIHEAEQEDYRAQLKRLIEQARGRYEQGLPATGVAVAERCEIAPDEMTADVDLFPLQATPVGFAGC